ncbi:MAG: hypothetical protein AAGI12_03695 [Pseudomonadota bacterium]
MKPAVRYIEEIEVDRFPTWSSRKKRASDVVPMTAKELVTVSSPSGPQVPVFAVKGNMLEVPTKRYGNRWMSKLVADLSPKRCINGRSVRAGGAGRGAVSSGSGSYGVACQN